jgi:hypothetical protein
MSYNESSESDVNDRNSLFPTGLAYMGNGGEFNLQRSSRSFKFMFDA